MGVFVCAAAVVVIAVAVTWTLLRRKCKRKRSETDLSEPLLSPTRNSGRADGDTVTIPTSPEVLQRTTDTDTYDQAHSQPNLLAEPRRELVDTDFRDPAETPVETPTAHTNRNLGTRVSITLENFPEHLLGVDFVKKGTRLARGSTAIVFHGKYGTIPVALKESTESLDTLLNEACTIMNLRHPNIVQAFGIWKDRKGRVYMVSYRMFSLLYISRPAPQHIFALGRRFWSFV